MNPTLSGWLYGTPAIQLPPQGTPGSSSLWASRNGLGLLGHGVAPRILFAASPSLTPVGPRLHAVPDPGAPPTGAVPGAATPAAEPTPPVVLATPAADPTPPGDPVDRWDEVLSLKETVKDLAAIIMANQQNGGSRLISSTLPSRDPFPVTGQNPYSRVMYAAAGNLPMPPPLKFITRACTAVTGTSRALPAPHHDTHMHARLLLEGRRATLGGGCGDFR